MKSFVELLKLYEDGMKLQDTNPNAARLIFEDIVRDENCPPQLRMTVERNLSYLKNTKTPAEPPQEKVEEKPKDNQIQLLPIEAIIKIPSIDGLMPISDEQYQRLKAGIAKRGVQVPLFVTKDYKLLAGYNRLRAATELGLKQVPVIIKDIPQDKILEFAVSDNIERRQMSLKDIATFLTKIKLQTPGRPTKRSKAKTTQEVAELLNVSPRSVERAKQYLKKVSENPELQTKSISSIVSGKEPVLHSLKFEFVEGVSLTRDNLLMSLSAIIDKILDLDTNTGDKVKVVAQIWHIKQK